jgi:nucleotidyltransferase substrate binding protein (TIGR01987 family)
MNEQPNTDNFGRALAKLHEFAATPIRDDRDRAGIIQAFEFTFEQCWKTLQRIAAAQGLTAASPRQALQMGMQLSLLRREDENAWLDMLRDRSATSHLYQETIVREIAQRVVDRYLTLLDDAHGQCL